MKNLHSIKTGSTRRGQSVRAFVMAAAVAAFGMAGSAAVYAQATAGKVFGNAPVGSSVLAKSTTNGTQREVKVDEKGRYAIRELPVGVYTVTLSENGQPVAKHLNVPVVVGRGIKVDFDGQATAAGQQ
ncbi:carboxypeptidase regulatory-like domain-containing protein [Frateuria sp. MAH-13]|uniref:Carboxypeptidase regulatory-like domain-containing protein n=1 Tax=Frateuria flava TaxID=2821489 RepID=A0ABS4DM00_9GAMM|nr:carboxypeptidase-like regulatory domain-containing protein [Frateuria flava]MBP1474071.1 carboxypeptidase regulatory-like domain-containing protein [Frateuria flava]